jgi:urease accessory protein
MTAILSRQFSPDPAANLSPAKFVPRRSVAADEVSVPENNDSDNHEMKWEAHLSLTVGLSQGRSQIKKLRFSGPLRVQKVFWPEKSSPDPEPESAHEPTQAPAHIYLLHPPGGLVSGDLLEHDLSLTEGAWVLFTSPAAAKIYRSRAGSDVQTIKSHLRVSQDSMVEWLPQGTIIFSGARANLSLILEADPQTRALGCDFVSLGRPASGETFDQGSLRQLTQIYRKKKLLYHELLNIEGGHYLLDSPYGLRGRSVAALFWALGRQGHPPDQAALMEARDSLAREIDFSCGKDKSDHMQNRNGAVFSVTLRTDLLLARALVDSFEEAEAFRSKVWGVIRPLLLGKKPVAPYIWST